jgi:pimeloyl-ACP methyl ester carboxylesterase
MHEGRLTLEGRSIEYRIWGTRTSAPDLVLLHEGLGSAALWRDFPARLAEATGTRVLAWSRFGYGRSSSIVLPRRPDYLHVEAREWLPRVLDALEVQDCVLFGHSDGASIALIHAADRPSRVRGLVLLAPHVKVEEITLAGIAAARDAYVNRDLRARLAKWHDDVDGAFLGWNDLWLDASFRDWNIEALVRDVDVPIVAIQGRDDEYGTVEQVESIRRHHPRTKVLVLDGCGHAPQRDRPDEVIAATVRCLSLAARPHRAVD